ncbi:tetratricopeptide repeat protein, partial [Streptomyces sp. NPDC002668]|uniref:tetratricopeptide repeat protein n=1 Tax=Streptomyces sp. NPDC002668 TaxID=3154422 RepID=UPI00333161B2
AFQRDLAMSLNNLSVRLGELGRREEALAAINEALHIRRQPNYTHPDAQESALDQSRRNQSWLRNDEKASPRTVLS